MTEPTTRPSAASSAPSRSFAPPPAMPSILASAIVETRTVLALTRRSLGLLLSRT